MRPATAFVSGQASTYTPTCPVQLENLMDCGRHLLGTSSPPDSEERDSAVLCHAAQATTFSPESILETVLLQDDPALEPATAHSSGPCLTHSAPHPTRHSQSVGGLMVSGAAFFRPALMPG